MTEDIIELTLNSPITEEQWDAIADVDFENTDRIWFRTKHGKEVEFVKHIRGKWLIDPLCSTTNDIYQVCRYLRCSECDHQEPWPWLTRRNFCPNCGADMREEEQE